MHEIKRGVVVIVWFVLIGSLGLVGVANAYSINPPANEKMQNAVNLPQLPPGMFNLNWTSFLNTLPVQGFITSLKSTSSSTINNPVQTVMPNITAGNGQIFIQQIDNWTSTNFGFRFSAISTVILTLLSWIFGVAKTVVDGLLSLIRIH